MCEMCDKVRNANLTNSMDSELFDIFAEKERTRLSPLVAIFNSPGAEEFMDITIFGAKRFLCDSTKDWDIMSKLVAQTLAEEVVMTTDPEGAKLQNIANGTSEIVQLVLIGIAKAKESLNSDKSWYNLLKEETLWQTLATNRLKQIRSKEENEKQSAIKKNFKKVMHQIR